MWTPLCQEYDPLAVGSIDGTDTTPHDHAVTRALEADYQPNQSLPNDPSCTVFVARLHPTTTEDTIENTFSKCGSIISCYLVRDMITGHSKQYAFIEYSSGKEARHAYDELHDTVIDGKRILVDMELQRTLPGWVPRRLGGGFGGRKESGQLRFGCRDRPFLKPFRLDRRDNDPNRNYAGNQRYPNERRGSRDERNQRYERRDSEISTEYTRRNLNPKSVRGEKKPWHDSEERKSYRSRRCSEERTYRSRRDSKERSHRYDERERKYKRDCRSRSVSLERDRSFSRNKKHSYHSRRESSDSDSRRSKERGRHSSRDSSDDEMTQSSKAFERHPSISKEGKSTKRKRRPSSEKASKRHSKREKEKKKKKRKRHRSHDSSD